MIGVGGCSASGAFYLFFTSTVVHTLWSSIIIIPPNGLPWCLNYLTLLTYLTLCSYSRQKKEDGGGFCRLM